MLQAGEIVIDLPTRCVTVAGQLLPLPAKEYGLLARLATAPTHVFAKQELLRDVWGYRSVARTRTVDSHACRLRRRLAELSERRTSSTSGGWAIG